MSKILDNAHDMARSLHNVGAMDDITMRQIDALCLPKVPTFSAEDIKRIRNKSKMSQAVFAVVLNTSTTTVQKWEQGTKKPGGMASRLLDVVDRKGVEALI
ncbi:helix-turn-helix domain-containing protein [Oceanidesulfovibrio marinus]|uniref:DNA-binding transcriptional regulator n=1 Tax=Oceanidesulfovibrio marinus TaxID=370038 RepID=A0ABX6NA97_9BACT|nr:DNA-binding transcriptional regulator [Oceanidesulfovibrio marinus]QJT07514.1 DNA-binding transcriptional regulator [Oceanidesulfovibrio marinus]